MGSELTSADLIRNRTFQQLADLVGIGSNAEMVLTLLGFRTEMIPAQSDNGISFWMRVCKLIEGGAIPGDHRLERLLGIAAEFFPGNSHFSPYSAFATHPSVTATPPPATPPPSAPTHGAPPVPTAEPSSGPRVSLITSGSIISVSGLTNRTECLEWVTRVASQQQPPLPVSLILSDENRMLFHFPSASGADALRFWERVIPDLRARQPNIHSTISTPNERDVILRSLVAEGPDQARFELQNVPGSTKVADIAQAIMNEYDPKVWGQDKGKPRPAVVDHLKEDGSTDRLKPEKTLSESGVEEGHTLHVAPESRAGSGVHPSMRDEALARVRVQIENYMLAHEGFEVLADAVQAPTEYIFRFSTPSWAPAPEPGGIPVPIEDHEVFLVLPADFPVQAPEAFWQTPIFHPNIHPKSGKVCLGALADRYRPGMNFEELCQMLVDIAAYRNYALEEGYNPEAAEWAISPAGQQAIQESGGESFLQRLITQAHEPRRLTVRRL